MPDVSTSAPLRPEAAVGARVAGFALRHWLLLLGLAALIIPTFAAVARESWSTEQGAHGPVVLATGIWLVLRMRPAFVPLARPGSPVLATIGLFISLTIYALGRISGTTEMEGFALYAAMVTVTYAYIGTRAMRVLWFPILYFAFLFPPPDSLVAAITQPLKLGISREAVNLLSLFGMSVSRTGVIIQVDQYDILVAAACAGMNSIISLSAIGLFYIYIRHNANWRYSALLILAILPVAVLANFVRVLVLILITYFFGDAAAQGFLHGFAGMTMFTVALLGIFAIDTLASPLRTRLAREGES
ncbi:exosortase V [Sphingomonas sp. BIUV-7]|uniref:Exosortase V n=1 Tax=Sphingomonas natans TaxID=3063330 RepID=A0ABT8Y6J3_9SPHN|nr:exosortase V [Sphingomonas sp. BIUV-7]MDO6413533.1 exosortase V [Sphingomonas sp. BIUV-7]